MTRYCANFAYRASFTYPGDAGAGLGCPQGHPESLAAAAFAPDDDASKVVHRIIALWRLAWHRHIAALQARATRTVATAAQLVRWRGARSWSWPWLPWRRPRSPCFPLRSGRCFRTWPPTAQIGRSRRVPRARHAVLIERHRGQRAVKAVTGVPPVGAQNIVSQINHFRQKNKKTSADVDRCARLAAGYFPDQLPPRCLFRNYYYYYFRGERGLAAALFVHTPHARTTLFSSAWFPCA